MKDRILSRDVEESAFYKNRKSFTKDINIVPDA